MIGMSMLSMYRNEATKKGYYVCGVSIRADGMKIRTAKKTVVKKPSIKYNYKLISASILKANTPNSANVAAMKATRKLGELLRSTGDDDSEPDMKAAIVHVRKMILIAKRKKKHLEQEEMAKQGKSADEDEENTSDKLNEQELTGQAEDAMQDGLEKEQQQIADEIRQMEQDISEELADELVEIMKELASEEEKMLDDMYENLGGEDVTQISADDLEDLKRKHRSDEWRDINKADMDYLKAKFYRLQQEKSAASVKSGLSHAPSLDESYVSVPVDISVDFSADIDIGNIGQAIDTSI